MPSSLKHRHTTLNIDNEGKKQINKKTTLYDDAAFHIIRSGFAKYNILSLSPIHEYEYKYKQNQSLSYLTMWFSGQSGVDVRTWSGGHGYGVRDRSWGAFCEGEGEVFRVLDCRREGSF